MGTGMTQSSAVDNRRFFLPVLKAKPQRVVIDRKQALSPRRLNIDEWGSALGWYYGMRVFILM